MIDDSLVQFSSLLSSIYFSPFPLFLSKLHLYYFVVNSFSAVFYFDAVQQLIVLYLLLFCQSAFSLSAVTVVLPV